MNSTIFSLLNEHVAFLAANSRPSVLFDEIEETEPLCLPQVHPERALVSSEWYAKSSDTPKKSQLSAAIFLLMFFVPSEPGPSPLMVMKEKCFIDDKFEYEIINGYEFDRVENNKIILKPIKTEYPKTYKECCDILSIGTMDNDAQGYKGDLIIRFQELIIARDAYWKIAGEWMGLGKSWEPQEGVIYCYMSGAPSYIRNIFPFPFEEMRDAFYENFKSEIEQCKELL